MPGRAGIPTDPPHRGQEGTGGSPCHTHLLSGLASLARGASGAGQTLGRRRGAVSHQGGDKGSVTRARGALSPCRGRGHSSPGSREHQRDLVHLFLQRDPAGHSTAMEGGQVAPEPRERWPGVALGGRGPGDTHGGAGGTLGTGFTVLASSTLRGGGGTGAGSERALCPPRAGRGPGHGHGILPRPGVTAASCPRPRHISVPAPAAPGAPGTGSPTPHPGAFPGCAGQRHSAITAR